MLNGIVTGIVGVALLALIIFVISRTFIQHKSHFGMDFGDTIFDAMDRIATGDFSVRLYTDDKGPLSEVSARVNRMAEELGTVEAQRQEFISNVSHEIQSPLTSIGGFAELLQNEGLTVEERRHYLNIIRDESARLSRLSDNLLKLTNLDETALDCGSFDLEAQLQSTVLMLEPQWQSKGLEFVLETVPLKINADEELLKQVWVNLLHNAIKFTPPGGRIELRTSVMGIEAGAHTNADTSAYANDCVVVSVEDTGVGISASDLPHIFERFYKVDRARDRSLGGNGLGLALAHRIAELHGGTVSVASELGRGTTFTVKLPLILPLP
jgi:signal transduction histidine kinase